MLLQVKPFGGFRSLYGPFWSAFLSQTFHGVPRKEFVGSRAKGCGRYWPQAFEISLVGAGSVAIPAGGF